MTKFSDSHKQTAFKLLSGAKTVEELAKETGMPYNKLQEQLKEMLKLGLVEKDGFPTKYALKPEITLELQRRQKIEEEDKNKFRLKAITELIAVEPELLKKTTETMIKGLQEDKSFTVYNIKTQPVMKLDEEYSTFIEFNVSAKDFRSLIRFMYYYGPSSVEVIKPEKIEFSAQDFQEGLMDMAQLIQSYTQHIAKLLNRQEMENLHKRIISGK